MVVGLTTAKFNPLIFSMSGFLFSYTANMFILMILYDFSLIPAQFYMIDERDIPSIQCKMSLSGPKSVRKVDGQSLHWFLCSSAHTTSQ
jgi:hypothetical protein